MWKEGSLNAFFYFKFIKYILYLVHNKWGYNEKDNFIYIFNFDFIIYSNKNIYREIIV